jgi:hypothetical protein
MAGTQIGHLRVTPDAPIGSGALNPEYPTEFSCIALTMRKPRNCNPIIVTSLLSLYFDPTAWIGQPNKFSF